MLRAVPCFVAAAWEHSVSREVEGDSSLGADGVYSATAAHMHRHRSKLERGKATSRELAIRRSFDDTYVLARAGVGAASSVGQNVNEKTMCMSTAQMTARVGLSVLRYTTVTTTLRTGGGIVKRGEGGEALSIVGACAEAAGVTGK